MARTNSMKKGSYFSYFLIGFASFFLGVTMTYSFLSAEMKLENVGKVSVTVVNNASETEAVVVHQNQIPNWKNQDKLLHSPWHDPRASTPTATPAPTAVPTKCAEIILPKPVENPVVKVSPVNMVAKPNKLKGSILFSKNAVAALAIPPYSVHPQLVVNAGVMKANLDHLQESRAKLQLNFTSAYEFYHHVEYPFYYVGVFGDLPQNYDPNIPKLLVDPHLKSEFDEQLPGSKISILFLCTKVAFDTTVTREYWELLDIATRHPLIKDVTMYGSGFPGWNTTETILENLNRHFGFGHRFDLVFLQISSGWSSVNVMQEVGFVHYGKELYEYKHNKSSLLGLRLWECWASRCNSWIDTFKPDIVSMAVPEEMLLYENISADKVIFHAPMNANHALFYHPAENQETRDIDILICGSDSVHYPLRRKFKQMVHSGRLNAYIRPHPGFGEHMNARVINRTHLTQLEQSKDYARDMKRAKIILTSASIYNYAVRKYHEAALAGALIIGTLPNERQDFFRKYVVEVKNYNVDYLLNLISFWLKNETKRVERAKIGQELFIRNYREEIIFELYLKAYLRAQRGQFGLWWTTDFSRTCRAEKHEFRDFPNQFCNNRRNIEGVP